MICQINFIFLKYEVERKLKLQRFFKDFIYDENCIVLDAEDKNHIVNSLRMKKGESLVVCDGNLNDYYCVIERIEKHAVFLDVIKKQKNISEPNVNFYLYQAIPKLNKLELIIQKSVELGVFAIVPILTRRCVATINEKNIEKKLLRFRKIAKQAASQSQRGVVPLVMPALSFFDAIEDVKKKDLKILFYEYGNVKLNNITMEGKKNIALIVGSEGGFDKKEIEVAEKKGIIIATLGKRILRCETAPICALSVLMHITGNL